LVHSVERSVNFVSIGGPLERFEVTVVLDEDFDGASQIRDGSEHTTLRRWSAPPNGTKFTERIWLFPNSDEETRIWHRSDT